MTPVTLPRDGSRADGSEERRLLIARRWIQTGEWLDVRSPYSGDLVARVAKGGGAEVRHAIRAAQAALEPPFPAHERAGILDRIAVLLDERWEELARLICAEAGKPIKTARIEVGRANSTYTTAAAEAEDRGRGRTRGRLVVLDLGRVL